MPVAFGPEEEFAVVTPAADHAVSHERRRDSVEYDVSSSDLLGVPPLDQDPFSVVDRMAHAEPDRLERNLLATCDDLTDEIETDVVLDGRIH
jgi:hypothetical protein